MSKSIFMTGASSGIGKALAFEFAERGYSLALTARRMDQLIQIRTEIQKKHPSILIEIKALDVTDYESIPSALSEMAKALKGLDIVFANAGIGLGGLVGKSDFKNAQKTIETNLIGAMATVDAAVAYFLSQGKGQIVATSSVAAFRGMPRNSSYCASKAGLSIYLESVRAEVSHKNIDVTVLHPGFIDTPLNDMLPNRPFVISSEKGAKLMASLIEKKVKSSTVPKMPWSVVGAMLKILPDSLMRKV
ncbi:SDR family oxidoreductase [Deltaproteobacteria bacterium TL4]